MEGRWIWLLHVVAGQLLVAGCRGNNPSSHCLPTNPMPSTVIPNSHRSSYCSPTTVLYIPLQSLQSSIPRIVVRNWHSILFITPPVDQKINGRRAALPLRPTRQIQRPLQILRTQSRHAGIMLAAEAKEEAGWPPGELQCPPG
jgi:hypothetical protein